MSKNEFLHGSINPHNIRLKYDFKNNFIEIFLVNYFNESDYNQYPKATYSKDLYYDQSFER